MTEGSDCTHLLVLHPQRRQRPPRRRRRPPQRRRQPIPFSSPIRFSSLTDIRSFRLPQTAAVSTSSTYTLSYSIEHGRRPAGEVDPFRGQGGHRKVYCNPGLRGREAGGSHVHAGTPQPTHMAPLPILILTAPPTSSTGRRDYGPYASPRPGRPVPCKCAVSLVF